MNTYGVIDSAGSYIDVAKTERGAKNYATRNGYKEVFMRFNNGYITTIVATKKDNRRWLTPAQVAREILYKQPD